MENHYTTKLNSYKHTKYPITFFDTSRFTQNEYNDIQNLTSNINAFLKDYNNIKKNSCNILC